MHGLRQVALALHQYESTHLVFPPGSQVTAFAGSQPYSKSYGWTVGLLPFVEQAALFSQFDFSLDCQIHHRVLTKQVLAPYICPSDPNSQSPVEWDSAGQSDPIWGRYFEGGWGATNYLGVSGTNGLVRTKQPLDCDGFGQALHSGIFYGNSSTRMADIIDGTSQTMFVGERGVTGGWGKWGGAGMVTRCPMGMADVVLPGVIGGADGEQGGIRAAVGAGTDRHHWWSWHPGGTHFSFADGSVRFVSYSVNRGIVAALSTRSDSEVVPMDW